MTTPLPADARDEITMGEIAYNAYREHTDGKSLVSGEGISFWQSLPDDIRAAWEAAGKAAALHWQPIQTAPGAGKRIIAWDPNYWGKDSGTSGEARWIGLSERWQLMREPEAGFYPTLWKPFPEPLE